MNSPTWTALDPTSPLRTHDALVSALVANLPGAAVFVVDRDLRYRLAEGDAMRATGVHGGDLVGRTVAQSAHATAGADAVAAMERHFREVLDGASFEVEHSVRGRWFVTRGAPLRDVHGTIVAALAVSHDVTERKRSEAALHERDLVWSTAVEVAGLQPWELHVATGRFLAPAALLEDFGLDADTVIAWPQALARVFADDRDRVDAALRRCTAGLGPIDESFRVTDRGRRLHWVRAAGRLLPAGPDGPAALRVVGVYMDLTAQQRIRERLRQRDAELASIADNAPALILRFDRALKHRFANRTALRAGGIPAEVLIGRTCRELGLGEPLLGQWEGALKDTFASGEPQSLSFVYAPCREPERPWLPGDPREYQATVVPERDGDGVVVSALVIAHDVTDLRRSEAALRAADARKDEFLAMLAHELRNPLAPLRTALRLIDREALSAPGRRAQEIASRQVLQMTRLVDDLLEVSRVTRGKIELRPEHIDAAHVVRIVAETLAPAFAERQQSLVLDLPPAPLPVHADPVRLAQIVENLLTNASKYTDAGGRIDLRLHDAGSEVVLEVRDTGIGIAAEHLPVLFELFAQVDGGSDRARGGLGIGLALVKRLVELHGGRVHAHSDGPGRGSAFTVTLPREPGGGAG